MAYDEALAARIRDHVAGEPVEEKRMFGGLAFLRGGHLAVAASGKGGLMVRVEPAETAALLAEPGASAMEMGGRGPAEAGSGCRPTPWPTRSRSAGGWSVGWPTPGRCRRSEAG